MKKLLILLAAVFAISTTASANAYTIDDDAVDALFETSMEIDLMTNVEFGALTLSSAEVRGTKEKSAIVATVICWFLGGIGVHRWYLGSKIGVYIGYCFLGGCLGFIDFWILLINGLIKGNGVGQYEGSEYLFMWKS